MPPTYLEEYQNTLLVFGNYLFQILVSFFQLTLVAFHIHSNIY